MTIALSHEESTNRIRGMRNCLTLCILGLIFLAGCRSRPRTDVKYVSLRIFEVVDCKPGGAVAVSVAGSGEKYCLAAKPVVDETDVKRARASRDDSGQPRLDLLFTKQAGERMRETTGRIFAEHQQRNDSAKMGLVIDGTLVEVPTLREAISDLVVVTWPDTAVNLDQIAESLNAHLPPPSSNGQK